MKKQTLIALLIPAGTLLFVGSVFYFVIVGQENVKEIKISSLDNKATYNFGKYQAKFVDQRSEMTNGYKITFKDEAEKNQFVQKSLNTCQFLLKDDEIVSQNEGLCKYANIDGYRFHFYEDTKDASIIYVREIGINAGFLHTYEFVPFVCSYSLTNPIFDKYGEQVVSYQETYESLNAHFKKDFVSDYETLKNKLTPMSSNLVSFDDENETVYLSIQFFPSYEVKEEDYKKISITCEEDYIEFAKYSEPEPEPEE